MIRTTRAMLACLAAAAAPPALRAQSPFIGREPVPGVWLEFQYPRFDNSQGYSAYLLYAGGRIAIGRASTLVVEIPMASSSDDSQFADDGFLLGNPYIGVRNRFSSVTGELGFRAPLVADDAPFSTALGAVLADFDRFEAFTPDLWTFRGDVTYEAGTAAGFRTTIGAGPTVLVPKDGDTELLLDYRLGVHYVMAPVVLGGWFTGRWIVTAEDADFNEATVHQLTLSAAGNRGRFRPAGYLRIPLDDTLDLLNMVVGVGLTLGF